MVAEAGGGCQGLGDGHTNKALQIPPKLPRLAYPEPKLWRMPRNAQWGQVAGKEPFTGTGSRPLCITARNGRSPRALGCGRSELLNDRFPAPSLGPPLTWPVPVAGDGRLPADPDTEAALVNLFGTRHEVLTEAAARVTQRASEIARGGSMEGFDEPRVERLLALPQAAEVVMVIAAGRGAVAGVKPQIRFGRGQCIQRA